MTITKITALALAAMISFGVAAPTMAAASKSRIVKTSLKSARPNIGIGLPSRSVSKSTLRRKIRYMTLKRGITLSSAELNQAVNTATNKLASAGNGPQKGIIHLKFRKFTICISWGADKGHC